MVKNRLKWLLPLVLVFAACEDEPIDNGNNSTPKFTVEFKGLLSNEVLPALGVSEYRAKSVNEEITISNWSMLFSEFSLIKENGERVLLGDGYQWLAFRNNRTVFNYDKLPSGSYKGIHFRIGLDSFVNHGNPNIWPADHPLNPNLTGLHWGWSGGYIFHAFDGMYRAIGSTGMPTSFSFHTATMQMVREFDLMFPFTLDATNSKKATINVHAENYFDGNTTIALKEGSVSHSEGTKEIQLMQALLGNMYDVNGKNGVFDFVEVK
jgi:hypothetical protein